MIQIIQNKKCKKKKKCQKITGCQDENMVTLTTVMTTYLCHSQKSEWST